MNLKKPPQQQQLLQQSQRSTVNEHKPTKAQCKQLGKTHCRKTAAKILVR